MVISKEKFNDLLLPAAIDVGKCSSTLGPSNSFVLTMLTGIICKKVVDRMYEKGLAGMLDVDTAQFTNLFCQALQAELQAKPEYLEIKDELFICVFTAYSLIITDIYEEVHKNDTANR